MSKKMGIGTSRRITDRGEKVLSFIRDHPGCKLIEITLLMWEKSQGGLTLRIQTGAYVGKLIKRGLVRRKANPTRYWLTRKGATALAALPDKPVAKPRSITLRADGFEEWGLAAAARLGASPEALHALYWFMDVGIPTSANDLLVREGLMGEQGLTDRGEALAAETLAACVRWQNGLPPDADLSFIKEKCAFARGDIVESAGQRHWVARNMGYSGWVEEYPPGPDGQAVSSVIFWLRDGQLCRKVGHEDKPAGMPRVQAIRLPQGGTGDGAGQD